MITKPTKTSSSKVALLIAGILVVILIAAVSAIIFLLIKNFENKDMVQSETTNQSVSEEVVQKDKINQNEKVQNDSIDDGISMDTKEENTATSSDKQELDSSVKYIFLPTVEKTYDLNGKLTKESLFGWEYYKSPTDYKFLNIEAGMQQMYSETTMERKGNKLKSSTNFYINNKLKEDFSSNSTIEYFDNTSIILNQETTKLNGEQVPNTIEVVKNQKVGNLIMLELLDNSTNTLKKIQINPNGVITERLYEDNELGSLREYRNYYYNGVFVATLYDVEYYQDNKLYSTASYKVEKEEVVDENNVKITLVRESEINGKKIKEFTIEYGLEKYIVENDSTVTPIDMEE